MATIERTAYPLFPEVLALQARYSPPPDELEWARRSTRCDRPRLGLPVLLKVFLQLHYFPSLDSIPAVSVDHVRAAAFIGNAVRFGYDAASSPTLSRHYAAVRAYLSRPRTILRGACSKAVRAKWCCWICRKQAY
nr:DUF4158 domain-containing protein [Burkholderia ambifaria]